MHGCAASCVQMYKSLRATSDTHETEGLCDCCILRSLKWSNGLRLVQVHFALEGEGLRAQGN